MFISSPTSMPIRWFLSPPSDMLSSISRESGSANATGISDNCAADRRSLRDASKTLSDSASLEHAAMLFKACKRKSTKGKSSIYRDSSKVARSNRSQACWLDGEWTRTMEAAWHKGYTSERERRLAGQTSQYRSEVSRIRVQCCRHSDSGVPRLSGRRSVGSSGSSNANATTSSYMLHHSRSATHPRRMYEDLLAHLRPYISGRNLISARMSDRDSPLHCRRF
jgi:hypothetical protein